MKEKLGKRVLFRVHEHGADGGIREGEVKALSSSGRFVQIGDNWFEVDHVEVVEELPARAKAAEKAAKVAAGKANTAAPVTGETGAKVTATT